MMNEPRDECMNKSKNEQMNEIINKDECFNLDEVIRLMKAAHAVMYVIAVYYR